MVVSGFTPTQGFRARAGVLTLMLASGGVDRRQLLLFLSEMLSGSDESEADIEVPSEKEVFWAMVEEDFLLEVADESMLEPDGSVGPDTPLRASAAGKELMLVAMALDQWLDASPEGPLGRKGEADEARGVAVAVLIGGLATTALHRVALGPCSVAEVCEAAPELEPELLESQLLDTERMGLIEAGHWDGETRYEMTEWGRKAIVPIVAAARFERRHPRDDTLAPDRLDVEMAFGFTLPMLALDPRLEGRCRLAVRLSEAGQAPAGVIAEVRDGGVAALETNLGAFEADPRSHDDPAPGTLIADADAWMEELVGGDPRHSELEGESELGRAIVDALRNQLFAATPGP